VGIIGGGQLARMLAESAHRLGLHPIVLAASSDDPAARLAPDALYGSWQDPVVLRRFFLQAPLVAFENEFVPCEALEQASAGLGTRFLPELGTLFQLQDKIRQKEILYRLGIPTSPYEVLPRDARPDEWVRAMYARFEGAVVFKWAQLGYDGKGTCITDHADEAARFCAEAAARGMRVFVERRVAFRRELAVVACHSTSGEFAAYPLVISQQANGICRLVSGPATALGVEGRLEPVAHGYARKLAEALPIHGTFAVELFETPEGELWVNELAPRVHNTGHYTQDAAATSQFENHWRAVLGLPLGDVATAPGFAMLNLLGPGEPPRLLPPLSSRVHLHWYGKRESRPGRKLGHLNGRAGSAAEVKGLVRELEACERIWNGVEES
jgi:5-(carboxyamino)imidazole ribonucleotide synthase